MLVLEDGPPFPHGAFRWRIRKRGPVCIFNSIEYLFALLCPALSIKVFLKEAWDLNERTVPELIAESVFYDLSILLRTPM